MIETIVISNGQTEGKQLSVGKHSCFMLPGQEQEFSYEIRITEERLIVNDYYSAVSQFYTIAVTVHRYAKVIVQSAKF